MKNKQSNVFSHFNECSELYTSCMSHLNLNEMNVQDTEVPCITVDEAGGLYKACPAKKDETHLILINLESMLAPGKGT